MLPLRTDTQHFYFIWSGSNTAKCPQGPALLRLPSRTESLLGAEHAPALDLQALPSGGQRACHVLGE